MNYVEPGFAFIHEMKQTSRGSHVDSKGSMRNAKQQGVNVSTNNTIINSAVGLAACLGLVACMSGCSEDVLEAADETESSTSDLSLEEAYAPTPMGRGRTSFPSGTPVQLLGRYQIKSKLNNKCMSILRSNQSQLRLANCLPGNTREEVQKFAIYQLSGDGRPYYKICLPNTGTFVRLDDSGLAGDMLMAMCISYEGAATDPAIFKKTTLAYRRSHNPTDPFVRDEVAYTWDGQSIHYVAPSVTTDSVLAYEEGKIFLKQTQKTLSERWSIY